MATAAEITKLVSAATEAARKAVASEDAAADPAAAVAVADAAEEGRAVDALKALAKLPVTAALLRDTDAGKRVNRLCKSPSTRIADAATAAVAAWKASVRAAAASSGGNGGAAANAASQGSVPPPPENKKPEEEEEQPAAAAKAAAAGGSEGAARPPSSSAPPPPSTAAAATTTTDPAAPPAHDPPPRTGDPRRDKLRAVLAAALALALPEIAADGGAEPDEDGYVELPRAGEAKDGNPPSAPSISLPGPDAPGRVAAAVEEEVFRGAGAGATGPAYAAKGRSLAFNLKAADNPALRRRVLMGSLAPERLVSMSAEELASDARRRENEAMREKGKWEAVRGMQQAATTDQFQCGKCKQRKTTFFQLQTRSADEPMTTFVTCVVCNNRWKFC
jgi:transcription elongation factor S-II